MFLPRATVAAMIDAGEVTAEISAGRCGCTGLDPDALARAARRDHAPAARAAPNVADLAQRNDGIDWPAFIEERIGHWAAAHFDRGQAFWPAPDAGAWASWQAYASRDLTPGLAGLTGFAGACARRCRQTRARPSPAACQALGLTARRRRSTSTGCS